jgi:hypothetical protein
MNISEQKGLTCDITLTVAEMAFGRQTVVPRYADGQMPFFDAVKVAVAEGKNLVKEVQPSAGNGNGQLGGDLALSAVHDQQAHMPAPAL